jgi:hypothetical protein
MSFPIDGVLSLLPNGHFTTWKNLEQVYLYREVVYYLLVL